MINKKDKNDINDFNRFCHICGEKLNEGNIARIYYTYDLKEPFIEEIRTDYDGIAWCQTCIDDDENNFR